MLNECKMQKRTLSDSNKECELQGNPLLSNNVGCAINLGELFVCFPSCRLQ